VVLRLVNQHIHRIFANTGEGFSALHAWLQEQGTLQLSVCLESTGSYSDAIGHFLVTHQYVVSLLHPAVLVSYRKTKNMRRKTDKVDAYLLALYGKDEQPPVWFPISDEVMRLRSLLGYRDEQVTNQCTRTQSPQKWTPGCLSDQPRHRAGKLAEANDNKV